MKTIILLSDTHSVIDDRIQKHLKGIDEIWHAGDIGDIQVTDKLKELVPNLRAVYGNIDNHTIRSEFPKNLIFTVDGVKVYITHIAGHPNKYIPEVQEILNKEKPKIFICGHSHILKVFYNKKHECLHLNPGAIGKHGFHKFQTMLKFKIENNSITDLNIIELKR